MLKSQKKIIALSILIFVFSSFSADVSNAHGYIQDFRMFSKSGSSSTAASILLDDNNWYRIYRDGSEKTILALALLAWSDSIEVNIAYDESHKNVLSIHFNQ